MVGDGCNKQRQEGLALDPGAQGLGGQGLAQAALEVGRVRVAQERPKLADVPVRARAGRAVLRMDLALEAPVGLAEVVQEGDRGQPLDQPFVAQRQAGGQKQPLPEKRVVEQRFQGRGDVGAVIDDRVPFKVRRLVARPVELP